VAGGFTMPSACRSLCHLARSARYRSSTSFGALKSNGADVLLGLFRMLRVTARRDMMQSLGDSLRTTTSHTASNAATPPAKGEAESTHLLPLINGDYRTAPRRISLFSRTFPSLAFFGTFFGVVMRAARQAKAGRYGGYEWSQSSLEVLRILESVGCQFEITGVDNLRRVSGPCVLIGNHMSTLETGVLPCIIQPVKEVTFVVKQSLVDYPIFKYVMRSRDPIAISQVNPREDLKMMLEGGADRLARGISLVVFPEGERRTAFAPAEFNTIGVKLASRAGVPLLPIALETSAWPRGKFVSDVAHINPRRKIRFALGEPVTVHGRGADEHQAVIAFIQQHLAAWRAEDAAPTATEVATSGT
jgi:1-acyl-sn-glycerol-3-phosphate acyltransferase